MSKLGVIILCQLAIMAGLLSFKIEGRAHRMLWWLCLLMWMRHYLLVCVTFTLSSLQAVLEEMLVLAAAGVEPVSLGARSLHMSAIPDALYMVAEERHRSSSPYATTPISTVDIIAGSIPGETTSSVVSDVGSIGYLLVWLPFGNCLFVCSLGIKQNRVQLHDGQCVYHRRIPSCDETALFM